MSGTIDLVGPPTSPDAPAITPTAGKWAMLQGDGTNWKIMAGN